VHLGSLRLPAEHLDEGTSAAAYVRPHDVVVTEQDGGVPATIERVASLGWLARVSLRLPGGDHAALLQFYDANGQAVPDLARRLTLSVADPAKDTVVILSELKR
jgi:ABC-type sulfate/molybdate transport systems ATPase subunit